MMKSSQARTPRALRTQDHASRAGRRGAVIVEFALTFMLFFVIVLGLMEMGRCIWTYTTLAHAARQTARFAQISGTVTGTTTLTRLKEVADRWAHGLNPADLTLTAVWNPEDATPKTNPANAEREDIVEINLRYNFRFISSPIIVQGSTLTLSSTSRMIVAN